MRDVNRLQDLRLKIFDMASVIAESIE